MLMLVMSNNFLQLFFGWEAVGLVSYLLIGFWFKRPTAIFANLKAFLVNRVGDFGFLLGIAGVLYWFGTLDYATVFANAADSIGGATRSCRSSPATTWSVATADLHLPVHRRDGQVGAGAAARVAAGLDGRPDPDLGADPRRDDGDRRHLHGRAHVAAVRAVARPRSNFVLFIGATTAFFTGLIGIVQNDIKRVVAYSTLSQLGYMTVALGVSAYSAAVFHLMTHAFFKALLFLGAGSVIIGMHHEQDMRRMGGLRKYMPITYVDDADRHAGAGRHAVLQRLLLEGHHHRGRRAPRARGAQLGRDLRLLGGAAGRVRHRVLQLPPAVPDLPRQGALPRPARRPTTSRRKPTPASTSRRWRTSTTACTTSHGHDDHAHTPHESPWVVTLPLILLAIPSILIGFFTVGPMLFGTDMLGHAKQLPFFLGAIDVPAAHDVMATLAEEFHGPVAFALHGFKAPAFWLAFAGFALATLMYLWKPELPAKAAKLFALADPRAARTSTASTTCGSAASPAAAWRWARSRAAIDTHVIDGVAVNGSARVVDLVAGARAPHAVRLPLPLRLRDDPRPDRAAGRADPAAGD